jgi:Methyltransferase domain
MIRDSAKRLVRALVRRRSVVQFSDPTRTTPVSREFGFERGTPVDRVYIERFVASHRALIRGHVLEIGDDNYTRTFGRDVTRSDVMNVTASPRSTLVADLTIASSLPSGTIDCVICTQTLNTIFDVHSAIAGLRQLVSTGGHVLVTVPGISQISRFDMERWGDYWRFTDATLRRLFEPHFSQTTIATYGNVATATALLQGVAVEDLPDRGIFDSYDRDYQVTLGVLARA